MVVHIGEHKTGTTSIQYFLHAERSAVARLGYYYPEVGLAEHQHAGWPVAHLGGHKIMPRDHPGLTSDELLERLATELPAGLTPVLSSEVYWELLDSLPKLFDEAMAVLRPGLRSNDRLLHPAGPRSGVERGRTCCQCRCRAGPVGEALSPDARTRDSAREAGS